MANTFVLSRSHLVYGLCIPLAVWIGYLLASGLDSPSMAVIVFVVCTISIPLFMRWHHPALVLSYNALICPTFLPGRPMLWMLLAVISFFFAVLDRSVGRNLQFFRAKWVSISLLFLAAVVFMTAYAHGGIGFRMFGASTFGGKKYFSLIAGILFYFGMSCYTVRKDQRRMYVAFFFLSGLTAIMTFLAAMGGRPFYFLVEVFPIESAVQQVEMADNALGGYNVARLNDFAWLANGVFCYMLARHGVRGILDFGKPWRLLLFVFTLLVGAYSGFRSLIIMFSLTFLFLFVAEGLHRTRKLLVLLIGGVLLSLAMIPNIRHLPPAIQRALAFLPINVDPIVKMNAEGTTNWRLEMWQEVLPQVSKHLFNGAGYGLDSEDFFLVSQDVAMGAAGSYETAAAAGDYHNGPLSILIPFGLPGMVGFCWFLIASVSVLRRNRLYGDPELLNLNTFLLVYFIVRTIGFFLVFGSLHSDLMIFAGLVGLSLCLNGGVCQPKPEPVVDELAE